MNLQTRIERLFAEAADSLDREAARRSFNELRFFLDQGELRAAQPSPDSPTGWIVNAWVKKGILLGFRLGVLTDMSPNEQFKYFDKDTYPLRRLSLDYEVRIVPGGTSVREGCFVGTGVVIMPPSYVNVGAYVDEGTMIDSHALVGSCAQIGKRVHISAAAQIGGVLEPIGAMPVIIEDEAMIGGNCGIYEGTIVKRRAVLGSGVILNRSTPVYDLVHGTVIKASADAPLVIPEGAVVVQGSRAARGAFAQEHGLSVYTPLIVKYRDEKTDAATVLEDSLR